jgi:predicted AAA+ superfamily ATPase
MINRNMENIIVRKLNSRRAIIILGARQVGKTTLVRQIARNRYDNALYLNCDEPDVRVMLQNANSSTLYSIIANHDLIAIDEAQRIENIGVTVKLLVDNFPEKAILITGSSSLEINDKIKESMTGRKFEFFMLPMSFAELSEHHSTFEEIRLREHRLVYGSYPEVVISPGEEAEILLEIASSYLFKDIFMLNDLRKPEFLDRLVKAIAFQLGNLVSYNELANLIGIDKKTVVRYIDLLRQAFVIFELPSYSNNARSELRKSNKIYFYDNGIRNAIINDFKILPMRQDRGALWENYLIVERMKLLNNSNVRYSAYFWRTKSGSEVDYIEERDGMLYAFEFKYRENQGRVTSAFIDAYPNAKVAIINKGNYLRFLTEIDYFEGSVE